MQMFEFFSLPKLPPFMLALQSGRPCHVSIPETIEPKQKKKEKSKGCYPRAEPATAHNVAMFVGCILYP